MYDVDLFVIGAGSGGVRAARMAATFGARVAIAEDRYMGGTCVNVGCVPKKLYAYAAHYGSDFEDSRGFGWRSQRPPFDWATLRDNKKAEISRLNGIYENLLGGANCQVIEGRASITGPHSVSVNGRTWQAERILIATGGWPFVPEFPGREHALTSNEIFDLENFPGRILIVGGGYIAVEFASIFAGLGAETLLSYRGPRLVKNFDSEIGAFFQQELARHVDLRLNSDVEKIERLESGALQVYLKDGQQEQVDCVLYATGRKPRLEGLGLEHTAVNLTDKGTIAVNGDYQTDEASIYALGDVVGRMELTPVALAEGMALAHQLYGDQPRPVDYDNIPTVVFSHPNIGTVGLSEEAAKERFGEQDIALYKSDFRHLKHTLSGNPARTFMKIVVRRSDQRVLGMHMVGEDAGEIMQGFAVAMNCGVTKSQLDATLGIHPTAAEEFVTMRNESQ